MGDSCPSRSPPTALLSAATSITLSRDVERGFRCSGAGEPRSALTRSGVTALNTAVREKDTP